jgi:glutaredoxin-like YruB-family protein
MADVKIYTTPSCPYCQMAKGFMKEKGVEYQEIDVSQDRQAFGYIVEKTKQMGVPVIEKSNQFVVGFDKPELAKILGIDPS